MNYYATVDAAGNITSIGSTDAAVPDGALALTEAEHFELMFGYGDWEVVGGVLTLRLDVARARANAAIDEAAGETRRRYITTVPGQAETYQAKYQESERYKAAGYPADITAYPYVAGEARSLYGANPTPDQCALAADFIITTQAQWNQLGAIIEEIRRTGKVAVDKGTTHQEIRASVEYALSAMGQI